MTITYQVLLLSELLPASGLNSVVGLHSSDSGEGPARSTSSLVLDSGYLAFVPPVEVGGAGGGAQLGDLRS